VQRDDARLRESGASRRSPELCAQDESKYAYPPAAGRTSPLLVTIGVGNDIEAELKWQRDHPLTRFVGADPFTHSGKAYERIGQWHAVGVSGVDGVVRSSFIADNRHYAFGNVPSAGLL